MLTELIIRNFAIIDELKIAFTDGLNVLTGETGAGKSIIIGAVSLLLGDRASADMIRTSEDQAMVEAIFHLRAQEPVAGLLRDWGFQNGEELIVRRIISRSGKKQGLHQRQCRHAGHAVRFGRVADEHLRPA